MSFALDIPYPAGTSGVSTALSKVAEGILNRLSRLGGVAVRRAGVVVGVLWPETMGDGTLFGAIANLLAEDQVRWVNDVAGATGVSTLVIGQELVDQLAVWEYANPGVAPPTYLYDDVVVQAQAAAAPQSGPTPNNVRISRILATTLGACAVLACAPPFLGGAHACMQQPPGDGFDNRAAIGRAI